MYSQTEPRPVGLFIAIFAIAAVAAAATLLPFTVDQNQRLLEVAAVVAVLLLVTWAFVSGPERIATRLQQRAARIRIRRNLDLVYRLDALLWRAILIFGTDASRSVTFDWASQRAEQAVLNRHGAVSDPKSTDEESRSVAAAQNVASGWTASSEARTYTLNVARGMLASLGRRDSHVFIESFRLGRAVLEGNYLALDRYVYHLRRAHPYRFDASVHDEWGKFQEEANRFSHDWGALGLEAGNRIGVEGPYGFRRVLDLGQEEREPETPPAKQTAPPSTPVLSNSPGVKETR